MNIQQCSSITNSSRDTLRYYEKKGLITPSRSKNGYRNYTECDVQKIQLIQTLKCTDLSLDDIKKLFELLAAPTTKDWQVEMTNFLEEKSLKFKKQIAICQEAAEITDNILSAVKKEQFEQALGSIWDLQHEDNKQ